MSNDNDLQSAHDAAGDRGGKYLTFALGDEGYGIEITRVREIVGYMAVTAVPGTPPHVKGVVNLRGQVISVMDLRSRFGIESVEPTDETCIVVVEAKRGGRKVSTGLVVDRVDDVEQIADADVEDAPDMGGVETNYIRGMGKCGEKQEKVKILLDADEVLGVADADGAQQSSPEMDDLALAA